MAEVNAVELKKYGDLPASIEDTSAAAQEVDTSVEESIHETSFKTYVDTSPIEGSIHTNQISTVSSSGSVFGNPTDNENNNFNAHLLSIELTRSEEIINKAKECIKSSDIKSEEELHKLLSELEYKLKSAKTSDEKIELVSKFLSDNNVKLDQRKANSFLKFYIKQEVSEEGLEKLISSDTDTKGITRRNKARNIISRRITNKTQENNIRKYLLENVSEYTTAEIEIDPEVLEKKLVELDENLQKIKRLEATHELTPEEAQKEAIKIADQFYEDTRVTIQLPKLKELIKKYAQEHNLSDDVKKELIKKYSDARTLMRECAVDMAENSDHKEILMKRSREDNKKAQAELRAEFDEYLPEDMTEEEYRRHQDIISKFAEYQENDICNFLDSNNFSDSFKEEMKKESAKFLEIIEKQKIEYITKFFETEKGRAIKAYVKHYAEEVQEAKKDYIKSQEAAEEAKQEAAIAQEESEKAIAKAKAEEKKARSIAEKMGYRDLEYEDLYKVVKKESPRQAVELEYAQADKKKAYWAEYDANVAKRLASYEEDIARKSLEFARIRMWAAIQTIQAFMGF